MFYIWNPLKFLKRREYTLGLILKELEVATSHPPSNTPSNITLISISLIAIPHKTSQAQIMKLHLIASLLAYAVASASSLTKRCSPLYDPELQGGYYPPAPCWQDFDPACQPYLAAGTEMFVDQDHGLAIIYGVQEHCFNTIAEELEREKDGRKTFGWQEEHGNLTPIPSEGILVISNMTERVLERYMNMDYQGSGLG